QVDANIGNGACATSGGSCTLRAAIQEANFSAAADTINLPAGTYQLTNTGSNEDAAATGDLDIGSDLTIQGAGPATTTVDGLGQDRVFDVFGGSVAINGIVIYNGNPGSAPGGGVQNSATLSLTNDTVTAGHTTGDGGGI